MLTPAIEPPPPWGYGAKDTALFAMLVELVLVADRLTTEKIFSVFTVQLKPSHEVKMFCTVCPAPEKLAVAVGAVLVFMPEGPNALTDAVPPNSVTFSGPPGTTPKLSTVSTALVAEALATSVTLKINAMFCK